MKKENTKNVDKMINIFKLKIEKNEEEKTKKLKEYYNKWVEEFKKTKNIM